MNATRSLGSRLPKSLKGVLGKAGVVAMAAVFLMPSSPASAGVTGGGCSSLNTSYNANACIGISGGLVNPTSYVYSAPSGVSSTCRYTTALIKNNSVYSTRTTTCGAGTKSGSQVSPGVGRYFTNGYDSQFGYSVTNYVKELVIT